MAWPSTVTVYTNPQPTDKLNSPSHSSIETAQNTGLTELQTFIGTLPASALGTILYDVRSPDSNGGGHVQTVNKGGTGQTTYTKGDVLIASSSSVLAKLAVGIDNQVLTANSSVAAGVQWTNVTQFTNKIGVSAVSSTAGENTTVETSIFSVTVPGSVLGTSGAVRATLFVNNFISGGGISSVFVNANYGSSTVSSLVFVATPQDSDQSKGKIEFDILANGSTTSQRNILSLNLIPNRLLSPVNLVGGVGGYNNSVAGWVGYKSSVASVDSNAPQTIGMTVRFNVSGTGTKFTYDGYTIEKIN